MKLKDLLVGINSAEYHAEADMEISGVNYDSRAVKRGELFVAVRGYAVDGHRFIPQAVESGAILIVCEQAPSADVPYVLVPDTRLALALISKNWFGDPAARMKMIGVTGTNGKTTTTMLIKHMLEQCRGAKVGLIGTNQNMIGDEVLPAERTTPESYELQKLLRQMADSGCEYVVMEVSSHSLVLDRVAGIRFAVAIFTNLTQDHLDFHRTMEEYAKAKARLFRMSDAGAFNLDDPWAEVMMDGAECRIFTYSEQKNEADLVAKDLKLSADGVKFCALTVGELERVRLGIPGKFSVYNALSVISCGILLGLTMTEINSSLSSAKGVKGRMEVVPTDGVGTVIIDYAHTPDALENALKSMREVSSGRLVVLFGCGGDRDRTKRPIMGRIAAENADYVIVTSDNPRTEEPQAIIDEIVEGMKDSKTPRSVICDRREAIAYALDNARPDDVILLAGKGHETYQIVGTEKFHMDEREIVNEHLEKRKRT